MVNVEFNTYFRDGPVLLDRLFCLIGSDGGQIQADHSYQSA